MEGRNKNDNPEPTVSRTKVSQAALRVEREPLLSPFGFKGGRLTELWQSVVQLTDGDGRQVVGLGVQSALWSDPDLFKKYDEKQANELMLKITQEALRFLKGQDFETPMTLFDELFTHSFSFAKEITKCRNLKKTFVLNALTPVDNALWLLHAANRNIGQFYEMIPPAYRDVLAHQNDRLSIVPVVSYGMAEAEINNLINQGTSLLKIKLGHSGSDDEMLEKDKAWMTFIHQLVRDGQPSNVAKDKMKYYLDANGRYKSKDDLQRLLDHLKAIGALEQVLLLEEPFSQQSKIRVDDLGVRVAMDERAHSDVETAAGIQMGYQAIALKPIAKTLTMTLRILEQSQQKQIPCFCADLTANPMLVEWNKNVAARLPPFVGMEGGLLEINGHQQYKHWDKMVQYHPCAGASWTKVERGTTILDKAFYQQSGCIFKPLPHYQKLFNI